MESNIGVLFTTLFMVLIMEMGDKTQLLVMAMTSKYRPSQVFWGIAAAILLLNVLAVLLGSAIGGIKLIQDCVRAGASILFIFFGLLSLREEKPEENKNGYRSRGIILTIALAFFLAEFGDKTQLSTFSFAALYPESPLCVFIGSTIGLLAADCLGLIAGTLVIKYVPKRTIALISGFLFIIFGLVSAWTTLKDHFQLDINTCIYATGAITIISALVSAVILLSQRRHLD
jgi:putative Ca2+/H+ antiporter (TMEM165/GDT1 family)